MKPLIPWFVSERDFRRYLGRALNACAQGRVVFFYHLDRAKKKKLLLALAPYPDWKRELEVALVSFAGGRCRRVVLEDLPAKSHSRTA